MRAQMWFCEYVSVCLYTIYGLKSHCSISVGACADILALPKNPQWSSPIQQPCPNKLCTSRLFSRFPLRLTPSLLSFLPLCPFDYHPLANPDHTIEPNHIWQFKLALFFPLRLLRFKTPLNRMPPVLLLHPHYLAPIYLCARVCVCVCHYFWMPLWV